MSATCCGVDYELIILLALTFFLAGRNKGIANFGLPSISLGILSLVLNLEIAMALMPVPSSATKLWQALSGSNIGMLLRRLWPFLLPATVTDWPDACVLARLHSHWLEASSVFLLFFYAIAGLTGFYLPLQKRMNSP